MNHLTIQTVSDNSNLPQDEQELLKKYRLQKEGAENMMKYAKSLELEAPELWTPEILLDTIQGYFEEEGHEFVVDEENKNTVTALVNYFTGHPGFEKDGRSLSKGIFLYGPVGVGKTYLMNIIKFANQRQVFKMVDCSDIAADFTKKDGGGELSLEKYFSDRQIEYRDKYGRTQCGYCFDDFGAESDGRYFGNTVNIMERIIEKRYRSNKPLITHMISNLDATAVKTRYGQRVADRMREMFNVIEFPVTAKSRRK